MSNASPPPLPTSRKGWSALAWVGIGCGGILLIALVVFVTAVAFFGHKAAEYAQKVGKNPAKAAAELLVKVNPELELVSVDEQAGTITVRIRDSGKIATVTYADIAAGQFSVTTEEGEFRIEASETGDGSAEVTIKRSDESSAAASPAMTPAGLPE